MTWHLAVFVAFILDYYWGDPPWLLAKIGHPVIFIGKIIRAVEQKLTADPCRSKKKTQVLGLCQVLLVLVITVTPTLLLRLLAYTIHPLLCFSFETFLCYQLLATRSLERESLKVYLALQEENLDQSRLMLSYIVGRETQTLSQEAIIKATVETVAENTTDGVIAPLFYMILGGSVGGVFYKTVNTLDSMLGYRTPQYEDFGKGSAILDDVVNWIPARLTAIGMLLAGCSLGYLWKQAYHIFRRDRYAHKSPNAGQSESMIAGLLGIQLAGDSVYFGTLVAKPTIGDPLRPIQIEDIPRTIQIMRHTGVTCLLFLLCMVKLYGILRG